MLQHNWPTLSFWRKLVLSSSTHQARRDVHLVGPNVIPMTMMGFQNVQLCQENMFNVWLNPKLKINNHSCIHNLLWREAPLQFFNLTPSNTSALFFTSYTSKSQSIFKPSSKHLLCTFYFAYKYVHRIGRLNIQAQCFGQEAKHDVKHHFNVPSCLETTQIPSTHTWFANHNTSNIVAFHILWQ
jgi:hypothetical protein